MNKHTKHPQQDSATADTCCPAAVLHHCTNDELRAVFDILPLGLVLVRDGQIVQVNAVFEKMFGYVGAELAAVSWKTLLSRIVVSRIKETSGDEIGPFVQFCTRYKKKFWGTLQQKTVGMKGAANCELYTFQDCNCQREMHRNVQRLGQAVEQSSNSIIVTDTRGIIEYVNPAFVRLTGYYSEEALGRTPAILKSGRTPRSVYSDLWDTIRSGKEWSGELINKKKNGELYAESVTISPIRNEIGEITHFVATKENLTDLKEAQRQADAANRAKGEFLANMSHELRTPLSVIIGMADLLDEVEFSPQQQKHLDVLRCSASLLLELIDRILEFSTLEPGKIVLERKPFAPDQLLDEVLQVLTPEAERKNLFLTKKVSGIKPDSPLLKGDPGRLKDIFLHLLDNGIRFTEQGGVKAELSLHRLPSEKKSLYSLYFAVHDTGFGIPIQKQEKIMESFSLADNSLDRRSGGAGLGLAVSNRLVERMGGRLTLQSIPGKGTVVSFNLIFPAGKENEETDKSKKMPVGNAVSESLEILLVEDNAANRYLAGIILQRAGHAVTEACNGKEALQCLASGLFDVVLMDIQMPVMDGVTATRYIRAFEQGDTQDMPPLAGLEEKLAGKLFGRHQYIAAVTAHALDNDRKHYIAAGMDAYLTKPYKCEELQRVFQEYVHSNHFPVLTECRSMVKEELQEPMISEEDVDRVRTHLGKCYGLSSDDTEIVLSTYIQTIQQTLARFEKALLERSCEEVSCQAHALKGALLNLGLDEQASAASILEKGCRENLDSDTLARADELIRRLLLMLKIFSSKKEQK